MTKLAFRDDQGTWQYWSGQSRPLQGLEGELFDLPSSAPDTYTWQKLRSFGLYKVTADAVPEGKAIATATLIDLAGKPHEALTFEDAPEPDAEAYQLYKSTIIRRVSEVEAATIEAVLASGDAKLRLLFNTSDDFMSNDPLFGTLEAAFVAAFGAARAAELLAA